MRISDWSSDVCSSDLGGLAEQGARHRQHHQLPAVRHADAVRRSDRLSDRTDPAVDRYRGSAGLVEHGQPAVKVFRRRRERSEEHTSELQSLMRISYAVFCLKKKKKQQTTTRQIKQT